MKRKKIIGIIAICLVLILAGVGIYLHGNGKDDKVERRLYTAESYEDLKDVLDSAEDTFALPDKKIMLTGYSFGFYHIYLDKPGGVPVGYTLICLDQPGDHYNKTVTIRCSRLNGDPTYAPEDVLEKYEGYTIFTNADGDVWFCFEGCRYVISCDLSSSQGGLQDEEVELPEGLRIAKNMIDMALLQE